MAAIGAMNTDAQPVWFSGSGRHRPDGHSDNGTAGTITYSGAVLTMPQGDCFVALPPSINFRYLGMVLNNNSGNLQQFFQQGRSFRWASWITLSTGSINGWTAKVLDLVAPVAARLTYGQATADYGNTIEIRRLLRWDQCEPDGPFRLPGKRV